MSSKFGPIFHVGYAVPDLDKAMAYMTQVMGIGSDPPQTRYLRRMNFVSTNAGLAR